MQPHQLGYPLYLDGKEVHGPLTLHHGPTPPPPMRGMGEYFSEPMSGLGQTMVELPAYQMPRQRLSWWSKASRVSPLMGALGEAADAAAEQVSAQQQGNQKAALTAGAALALVGVGLLIRGAAGYYAGKAMAPSRADADKYAWGGVAVSVLLGSLGLGIEGVIALRARKG